MRFQSVIGRSGIEMCDHVMWALGEGHHRLALVEELRVAGEEAIRLMEMIRLLRGSPYLNGERIDVLTIEWKVARDRTIALAAELQELDGLLRNGDEFVSEPI